MNKKQFIILIVVLLVLLGAGAWVQYSDQQPWKQTDTLAGKKLLPALTAISVAQIGLVDGANQVHLVKHGNDWTVTERADFPADVSKVAQLLDKVVDLKIIQSEKVPNDKRGDYQLLPPAPSGGNSAAGAGQGTTLELKDASGKVLDTLLLGKQLTRRGMIPSQEGGPPREGDVPYGRYVVYGTDTVAAVNEPLANAVTKPDDWLVKELIHVDPAKSITSIGPGGDTRWTLVKGKEGLWSWPGSDKNNHADPQKAQDVVSSLYAVMIKDVVPDPAKVDTGLDKPVTIRAETPVGLTYTVKIGKQADDGSYYATLNLEGELARTRPPVPDEKPEDKARNDKAYTDDLAKMQTQVQRERQFSKWTYRLPKYASELLIRDKTQLLPEKKPDDKAAKGARK